ncbi:MAG: hypothetical protein IIZ56_00050, partial [Clostridia bacterium]|nr:hypothetical protein [Clostridia bacterium]
MFRKTISIITAVLLVLAVLPFSAFADTTIDRVDIIGFSKPVVGEVPDYQVAVPENAGYKFEYYYWFEIENGSPTVIYDNNGSVYEDGVDYFMYFVISAKSGFAFPDNTQGFVHFIDDSGNELYVRDLYFYDNQYYIYSETHKPDQMSFIDSVELSGYAEPCDGMPVSGLEPIVLGTEGCELASCGWFRNGAPFNGVFTAGNTYELRMELKADYGTRFAEDVTVSIEGAQTELSADRTVLNVKLEKSVTEIRVVSLNTAYTPVAGAHIEAHPALSLSLGSPYTIS